MTRITLLIGLFLISISAFAQDRYTYISDRKFFEPSELVGYQFIPSGMEIPGEMDSELDIEDYSFGITSNNLYVSGEGLEGVFSINSINTTEYGYKMNILNARNPAMQGHMKFILNKNYQVEVLVFRRSKKEKEIVFFLPILSQEERKKDREYFTDYGEITVELLDSIWGKELIPFFRIDKQQNIQDRLTFRDSVTIKFIEEVEIIEKIKKPKKVKKAKKAKNIQVDSLEDSATDELPDEYFDEVEEGEESNLKIDLAATPPITQEMVDGQRVKTTIKKHHFVEVRSYNSYDDGTSEMKVLKLPINKLTELEDESARPGEERFQISFESDKMKNIFLYLTADRKVTAFELGSTRYDLRF